MRPWRNRIARLIPVQKVAGSIPAGRAKIEIKPPTYIVWGFKLK